MDLLKKIGALRCQLASVAGSVVLAPVILAAAPGSALQYDGLNGYVQVTNNQNLNPFPFTVSAWIRTTNASAAVQGVVSKYVDGSGNGWSLTVQNGRVTGY
jgi:hypothetical protein